MSETERRQPTAEQRAIIEAPLEPLLVIAGAGSGKTTTMADRVVHLVANELARPEEILGVTFTRKAAGELAARVRLQLQNLARERGVTFELEPEISTYHSYAKGIVGDYGLRLGVEKDAVVLGQAQCWQLASQVVQAYDGDLSDSFDGAASTLVQAVMSLASECSEHLRQPTEVAELLDGLADRFETLPYLEGSSKASSVAARNLLAMFRTRARVAELVSLYQQAKRRRNALDYGDLVALAAAIAEHMPTAREQERERHKVVLLDEFQDTSHAQLSLFAALYDGGHPVTAVGDPHQSIYGFRGASAGQLFRFPQIFRRADGQPARTAALTVAWRNSLQVLQAANVMSAELNRRAAQQHANSGVPLLPLQPKPAAPSGEVQLARFGTETEEAAAIAESVLQRRSQVARAKNQELPSIAVLCRRRSQFDSLQQAFEARGIDYIVLGLGGLLGTAEVIDVVATLQVLVDPGRSDSLMRLLSGARWRIGPSDLMALADWSKYLQQQHQQQSKARSGQTAPAEEALAEVAPQQSSQHDPAGEQTVRPSDAVESASLIEALDALEPGFWPSSARALSDEGRRRMLALRDELRSLRTLVGEDLLSLISEVERTMLLDIELAARPGTSYHRARHHLDAFADAASGFLQSAEKVDVLAFLSWLKTAEQEERGLELQSLEAEPGAVQLLTVHAAKGLEWDEVYLPALATGVFPSARVDRWSKRSHSLPWPLRGDVADLPVWDLAGSDQKSWLDAEQIFADEVRVHSEDEERRLAYVAYTRARNFLMVSTSKWIGTAAKAREVSPFIAELRASSEFRLEASAATASSEHWLEGEQLPEQNPNLDLRTTAEWPYDPLQGPTLTVGDQVKPRRRDRRVAVEAAAERVRQALRSPSPELWARSGRWGAEAQGLLARRKPVKEIVEVEIPAHLSASTLVELKADTESVIRQIRRPVPRRPGLAARKGTAFHGWVEQFYGAAGQLELGDFLAAADEFVEDSYQLAELKENFASSEWAQLQPTFVEVPIETQVAGIVVRGRIDAVFQQAEVAGEPASWELVDWKTGRVPNARELEVRAVQLAIYRLAWSRLKKVPLERVRAAFYYVGQNKTIRMNELADEDQLESIITAAYRR